MTAHNLLFFDTENITKMLFDSELAINVKIGNLTDPAKIEEKRAKAHAVSPNHCQIVALEWTAVNKDGAHVARLDPEETEKDMLKIFFNQVYEADYIIGFNSFEYDIPVLLQRACVNNIKAPSVLTNLPKYRNKPSVDLMQVLAGWNPKRWQSLDWWCKNFKLGEKSGDGSEVWPLYKKEDFKAIQKYCQKDTDLTMRLFYRICETYLPEIILF